MHSSVSISFLQYGLHSCIAYLSAVAGDYSHNTTFVSLSRITGNLGILSRLNPIISIVTCCVYIYIRVQSPLTHRIPKTMEILRLQK